jgi:hypothetical protein
MEIISASFSPIVRVHPRISFVVGNPEPSTVRMVPPEGDPEAGLILLTTKLTAYAVTAASILEYPIPA